LIKINTFEEIKRQVAGPVGVRINAKIPEIKLSLQGTGLSGMPIGKVFSERR
jgi:hypothetical protein